MRDGIGEALKFGVLLFQFFNQFFLFAFDASAFSTRFAGEVKGFDPLQWVEKKEVKKVDPFIQYAVGTGVDWQLGTITTSDDEPPICINGFCPPQPQNAGGKLIISGKEPDVTEGDTGEVAAPARGHDDRA